MDDLDKLAKGLTERETYSTYAPICPHCDHVHQHDGDFFYDEGLTEFECEACGKAFSVRIYTSTSWTCTAHIERTTHD